MPGGREVHCQRGTARHAKHRAMGPVMRGNRLVAYWVEEWT